MHGDHILGLLGLVQTMSLLLRDKPLFIYGPTGISRFLKSNINISSIGFGGAPIGDLFENLDDSLCQEILKESYKKGLNFYDTSPYYGSGLSEVRIGNFLKSIKREEIVLSTKVGRYLTPEDPNKINRGAFKGGLNYVPNIDYTYDGVMRSFEQSLIRLAVSKVDICLIVRLDAILSKW